MSNWKLGILAAIAVVIVVLTVVSQRASVGRRAEPSGPAYLIQGLDPAGIGSIVVGHGDKAVKIERREGRFVVVNEDNYPADTQQINDLITKAFDIKTSNVYTEDPANHEELEVTEAKARHVVKFFKQDGSLLTGVVIGKSQENGQATYVRLVSGDTVYLAESVPWFRDRALDYIGQEITTIKREDVNAVTVTTPEGAYTLRPGPGGEGVVLADLPADKKLKDSDAKSVLNALAGLRLEDVNTPAQMEGLAFDYHYVCQLDDLTEYRLRLAEKGDKTYLTCEAEYMDPTKVMINPKEKDSPEELKKKEAKLLAQERAQKFTLRHKNWVYRIPDWKARYLTMSRSALLEDVKKETETKTTEPNQTPTEPPKAEAQAPAAEPNQTPAAGPAVTTEPNQPAQ